MINLTVGDKIIYDCAVAKDFPATVIDIVEGKNAAHDIIEWLVLEHEEGTCRLAYTKQNMAMMKVRFVGKSYESA